VDIILNHPYVSFHIKHWFISTYIVRKMVKVKETPKREIKLGYDTA
jgi:hypothetical protein